MGWLRAHDPDLAATRRAARTALLMPALFALCGQVFHSPTMASFAAFGAFSMLLLVDFTGPMLERLRAQAGLAVAWLVLISVGTLVARPLWLAVAVTVLVGFAVLFAGVVSSVLAGSSTALLLAFVLPVASPAPLADLPARLAGAGLAAAAALPAVCLLWPRPVADPLGTPAVRACRAAAEDLRADASGLAGRDSVASESAGGEGSASSGSAEGAGSVPSGPVGGGGSASWGPAGADRAASASAVSDEEGGDRDASASAAFDQAESDRAGVDRAASQSAVSDQAGVDWAASEPAASDPAGVDSAAPHLDSASGPVPYPDLAPHLDSASEPAPHRGPAPSSHPAPDPAVDAARRRFAMECTAGASAELRAVFDATPYRPTGLSATSRALVRLVDELTWLCGILGDRPFRTDPAPACDPAARTVRLLAADVLDHAAGLLTDLRHGDPGPLCTAADELRAALRGMERSSTARLPAHHPVGTGEADVYGFLAVLDLSFRAQELGFAVLQIAGNVRLAAAAEQRGWIDRLLGRDPDASAAALTSARERAAAHLGRGSVWLHNSLRGAVGLGIAVLLAGVTDVQHSFWVLLGTLSVLRSNALSTGQNALRAVAGTVVGSIVGAGLLHLIGHHGTALWFVLPVAILMAGIAPAAISFAAGQAAFAVTLVVLFNIGHDPDFHVALLRVQDIALGCAVSIVVAVFFWPRGAAAAVHRALAAAYTDSAGYLADAVARALGHPAAAVDTVGREAAAAARRLDDAFRTYLAERGAKSATLADMATLVTGVVALRLAADAVVSLWSDTDSGRGGDPCAAERDGGGRTEAHRVVLGAASRVAGWYRSLAVCLDAGTAVPAPLQRRPEAAARLVESVRSDLVDDTGRATGTAVRVIWTGDHVDAARRLQSGVATAARGSVAGG
ncbi:FUSC family protein [Streptomyces sp. NPDC048277]|uniref:FUSC family protein n=1 Tax=Streptomyces sp. NPDC048277 TaxID=3155027 RepID=UPI0034022001